MGDGGGQRGDMGDGGGHEGTWGMEGDRGVEKGRGSGA